jgi:hypothetical protein
MPLRPPRAPVLAAPAPGPPASPGLASPAPRGRDHTGPGGAAGARPARSA